MFAFYRVVIGYDEGTIMVKLGREVPVASMDNTGKIIWAKHNEIQTANIKSIGADYEVFSVLISSYSVPDDDLFCLFVCLMVLCFSSLN